MPDRIADLWASTSDRVNNINPVYRTKIYFKGQVFNQNEVQF